jgi:hypothetical protein
VPKSARDATAKACARLFDVPRARLRLIAGGKTLATEEEVARVAEAGETVLVVGSVRNDIVATASPLDRARARRRVVSRNESATRFSETFSRVARAVSRPPRRACGGSRARSSGPCTRAGKTRTRRRSTSAGAGGAPRATPGTRRRRRRRRRRRARDDGQPHQLG